MKDKMGKVRGLAIEVRSLGREDTLTNETFCLTMLRKAFRLDEKSEQSVCRYPCSNFCTVLPCFDVQAQSGGEYDKAVPQLAIYPAL